MPKNTKKTLGKTNPFPSKLYTTSVLLLVVIFLFAWLVIAWKQSESYQKNLDSVKENQLIEKTRLEANILDKMILLIQQRTDDYAQAITNDQPDWHSKDWQIKLDQRAKKLSDFQVDCQIDFDQKHTKNQVNCAGQSLTENPYPIENSSPNLLKSYSLQVFGSAIAFAQPQNDLISSDRWSTYYYDQSSKHKILHDVDYTNESLKGYHWFYKPVNSNKNMWVAPFLDDGGDTYMITYSSLIYDHKNCPTTDSPCQPIGVVTSDISINQIEKIIESLISGGDGFGALTYGNGLYLYHPERDYVKEGKSLEDIAKEKNDPDRHKALWLAKTAKGESIPHISTTTGEASWLVIEPLPNVKWSLQNTFFKDSFYLEAETDQLRQHKIEVVSIGILFLAMGLILILQLTNWNATSTWIASSILSFILMAGIGYTWDLALNNTKPKNSEDEIISTFHAIEAKKNEFRQRQSVFQRNNPNTISVPTGVYIQTIELVQSNEVNISGRIWQIFKNRCNEDCEESCSKKVTSQKKSLQNSEQESNGCIKCTQNCIKEFQNKYQVGLQFASARNSKFEALEKEINENGDAIVSWWFQADIATKFDYSRYPLEVEYLDLHIIPKSVSSDVLLVPDVGSYKFGSNRRAGISENLFVPGWEVFRSYFTLKNPEESRPTFGMQQDFDRESFYELHFKVGLKRIFVDAFISNLTPLIVVAIILFSVALLPGNIDISRILGICVSVFFVVVFSHLSIRRNISSGEIFYLEYFFFAIYATLLLVPVDAFRQTLGIKSALFEYGNGLIYKVLYWPSLLSIFYIVTINKFY